MTPYQIEIMLHCHCSSATFPRANAPAFYETIVGLMEMELIEPMSSAVPGVYVTTERGKALVEMWKATPLPEKRFVDPRFPAA